MDPRVERGMRRQLAAAPADRIGWKLGLNAPAIMERLGLPEPALGWLARSEERARRVPTQEPSDTLEFVAGFLARRRGRAADRADRVRQPPLHRVAAPRGEGWRGGTKPV